MALAADDTRSFDSAASPTFFQQRDKEHPQPAPGLTPGKLVGDFRLVALIGQGGMGQVWQAEQMSLGNRHVAVKFVRPERVTERQLEFFAREARAGGRLSHQGIVAVHGYGESDRLAWIAMEFVPGAWTLRDFLDEAARAEELPDGYNRHAARFVAEIADAMHTAHESGVIHRDLKPQNVLVTPDDHPKVTDFGLARITDESAMSQTGDFAGTYHYMSPEQVASRRAGLDHRTDVFSLGVVLYEILTLQRPFRGDTSHQIAEQILTKEPPDPRSLRSRVPHDLAVIAAKAMEKDRDKRFQTMKEFAADLRRHLANEPIHARPPTLLDRAIKWTRRSPTIASVAALFLVAFAIVTWLLIDNRAARLRAEESDQAKTAALLRAEQSDRDKSAALQTANAVQSFLTDSLRAANPAPGQGAEYPLREWLFLVAKRLDSSLKGQPEVRCVLENVLSSCFAAVQDFWSAYEHAKRSLALMNDPALQGTSMHLTSLTTLAESVIALHDQGELPPAMIVEAREALELALSHLRARHAPKEHIDALSGSLAYLESDYSSKKIWPEMAVQYVAQLWGRSDLEAVSDELEAKTRRVGELWDAGKRTEATQILIDGARNLDTSSGRRIAGVFFERVAQAAYEKKGLGSFSEACFATALQILANDADRETDRLSYTALWAQLVRERGDVARALPMLEQTVPALEKRLTLTNNTTASAVRLFARCLGETGRVDEGLTWIERLRAAELEKIGAGKPALVPTMRVRAELLLRATRVDEALGVVEAAAKIPLGTKPEDQLEGLRLALLHGGILLAADRAAEAEKELVDAWSRIRALGHAPPSLVSDCRAALARLYDATGRPDMAAAYH